MDSIGIMKRKSFEYYLKSIDRRWKIEIKNATGRIIILSPYLTSKTAELILGSLEEENCEIYTVFSVKNFASGASSLKTLKLLSQRGFPLYHLSRLHAKMIVIPDKFVSIGSQNLTKNGVRNKEASVVTYNSQEVERIETLLEKWLTQRHPITYEMLNEAEEKLLTLRRKFCSVQREADDLESEIWEKESKRIKEARLAKETEELRKRQEEERKLEEARLQREIAERQRFEKERREKEKEEKIKRQQEEKCQEKLNAIRARVLQLAEHGKVERSIAEEFIRKSAYWYDHPCGHPARAPRHFKRIKGHEEQWWIEFGSNKFLVGHAIFRCHKTLLEFLDNVKPGAIMSLTELRKKLELDVIGAVANYEGHEYEGYYSAVHGDYMKFGSQAININDFVNLVLAKVQLNSFFGLG